MSISSRLGVLMAASLIGLAGCSPATANDDPTFEPKEVVDLGALVTEDLPQRVWGAGYLASRGFGKGNTFEVVEWEGGSEGGRIYGSNAYYTLFNHGGPHLDAPSHISVGGGLDTYPVEDFSGPLRVFDVRDYPPGRTVPEEVFSGSVQPGEVVLIFTEYTPPEADDEIPEVITLTPAAAEYLANLPVRAFGTDAWSVFSPQDNSLVEAATETAAAAPIHYAFLSRGIPIYEQLFSVDRLLNRSESESMHFVGVPLNIKDGDGMIVRPVVFVY
jgi:kynurenine formamidase